MRIAKIILTCAFLAFGIGNAGADEVPVIRIGISEFAPGNINMPIIDRSVEVIKKALPEYEVIAKVYPVPKLQEAVEKKEVNLVISSAGFYRKMFILGHGIRDLATVVSSRFPNPNYSDGSVFVTLKENEHLNDLRDLKGKTVAANHNYGFSGWFSALGEIEKQGFDPDNFFGSVKFKGHEMDLVVKALVNGEVSAIITKTCFLEDRGYDMKLFKAISPKKDPNVRSCLNSTDLYPNWTISALPNTPPEVSRKVTSALLAMKPMANFLHWSVATNFKPVDMLFLKLKMGPYEYLRDFHLKTFVKENQGIIALILMGIIGLFLHSWRSRILVEKRTRQLRESLKREVELKKEAADISEKMSNLQKTGVVGQMSAIIAHELGQPLGSISTFSYALLRSLDSETFSLDKARNVLTRITEQGQKAAAIVDKVRGYARGKRDKEILDLGDLIKHSVADLRKTVTYGQANITLKTIPDVKIEANPLEIELLTANLIKNAVESGENVSVTVTMEKNDGKIDVIFQNTGAPLSDAVWDNIVNQKHQSSKPNGLGFGLSIVRSIVEDAGGKIVFTRPEGGGLIVRVEFPIV